MSILYQYFVQAGAFPVAGRGRDPARQARDAGLRSQGQRARAVAGQLVHRVRLGPYRSKAEAERAQQQLSQGVKVALIRVQR